MAGFRDNDSQCVPNCELRKGLEDAQLPGPAPAEICNATAAMMAMGGVAVENCPLNEVDLGD